MRGQMKVIRYLRAGRPNRTEPKKKQTRVWDEFNMTRWRNFVTKPSKLAYSGDFPHREPPKSNPGTRHVNGKTSRENESAYSDL